MPMAVNNNRQTTGTLGFHRYPQNLDSTVEAALIENHAIFLQFLARRLKDKSAAEDVLQSFYVRAVSKGAELKERDKVVAWLYRILRSVLSDHYRREAAMRRRDSRYALEQIVHGNYREEAEQQANICNCFYGLLPTLRPEYSEVLRRLDLSNEPREKVASELSTTSTNLRVRLHRARNALRKALVACCGSCCEQDYRDCFCGNDRNLSDQSTCGGDSSPVSYLRQIANSEKGQNAADY